MAYSILVSSETVSSVSVVQCISLFSSVHSVNLFTAKKCVGHASKSGDTRVPAGQAWESWLILLSDI